MKYRALEELERKKHTKSKAEVPMKHGLQKNKMII